MAGQGPAQVSSSNRSKEVMKLLVAVDFGTTFSGVAYVQSKQHHKQEVIQWWGEGVKEGEKAPTVLKYDDGVSPGSGPYKWGFQVDMDDEEGGTKYEWFKLGFYPHLGESDLVKKYPLETPQVSGAECEKLVVDYLTAIRENFDRYTQKLYRAAVWRSTPKEYIITVPAVWPDKSKDMTRACAQKAGMGSKNKIQIFAEPEAAGIYALDSMNNIDLNENDTFVLCDAGGGTVDLISYTVRSLAPVPSIREAASGSGGLCGSSFLNRIFAEYLNNKFKDYPAFDEGFKEFAMKDFEDRIKRVYAGADNKSYFVAVRGLRNNPRFGINRERLEIPGKDLREIFEPVMTEIVKLVRAQIRATKKDVKAVLMAGGFGRNEYLRARLQDEVGAEVAVLNIENSNTSIVRGALIRGLARVDKNLPYTRLDGRIARRHYGILNWVPFIPDEGHEEERKEVEEFTGEHRIEVMRWLIEKGTTIKESKPIPIECFARKAVDEGALEPMEIGVFVCEDPENDGPPLYKTAGVDELVKLKANLDCIPKEKLKRERGNDGREYYRADFDIEMTLSSASLAFNLVHAGKTYEDEAVEAEFA